MEGKVDIIRKSNAEQIADERKTDDENNLILMHSVL